MSLHSWGHVQHGGPVSTVASYIAARPRGMSNPPQNPEVRRRLLRDLRQAGISLEPLPRPQMLSCQSGENATWEPRTQRPTPTNGRSDGADGGRVNVSYDKCEARGGGVDGSGVRTSPWNPTPRRAARWRLEQELWGSPTSSRRGKLGAQATCLQDPVRSTVTAAACGADAGTQRSSARRSSPKGYVQDAQGPHDDEEPKKSSITRALSDTDLHSGIAALRMAGRMHRATVQDIHRAASDLSMCGSMVLSGPNASPSSPSAWASHASMLTKFHNAAMRTVNPSGLERLPPPRAKRTRRAGLADDDGRVGEVGNASLRCYKGDEALRRIREIRHVSFPEEPPEDKEAESEAQRQRSAARALAAELGPRHGGMSKIVQ